MAIIVTTDYAFEIIKRFKDSIIEGVISKWIYVNNSEKEAFLFDSPTNERGPEFRYIIYNDDLYLILYLKRTYIVQDQNEETRLTDQEYNRFNLQMMAILETNFVDLIDKIESTEDRFEELDLDDIGYFTKYPRNNNWPNS